MAGYDSAEVRSVLREHGIEVTQRGKVSAEHVRLFEELTGRTGDGPPAADYDGGVSEADFADAGEPGILGPFLPAGDGAGAVSGPAPVEGVPYPDVPPAAGERAPKRPRRPRPTLGQRAARLIDPGRGGKPKPKAKGKGKAPGEPRRPVDRLAGRAWRRIGRTLQMIDQPAGRCMELQSGVAGHVVEEVVPGTPIDRVLQVAARYEDKGRKVFALAAPVLVIALRRNEGVEDETVRAVRRAMLYPMLREALATGVKLSGDYAEVIAAREEEDRPAYEAADAMIALIFEPPGEPGGQASAEDEAVAAAQAMAGGIGPMAGARVGLCGSSLSVTASTRGSLTGSGGY